MNIIGLIDCNAFYCSCQRAFDPEIKRKPVVVLSNNDGCAIARTQEAKKLGIKMGDAWHKLKDEDRLAMVRWYSSNYQLYGDMSRRVFQTLYHYVPRVEPYSIDEMFLDLTNLPVELKALCRDIRASVQKLTKIPTCIGWGTTKTIAKFANHLAKERPELEGLCDLTERDLRQRYYRNLDISEIWGIGRRLVPRLYLQGIRSIEQFIHADPSLIRSIMGMNGIRLQRELDGYCELSFSEFADLRKGVTCSRSFGRPLRRYDEIREALVSYVYKACSKLRRDNLDTCHITVFLTTNRFYRRKFYANQVSIKCEPTNNSQLISQYANMLLKHIYRRGYAYVKTGVTLNDLAPSTKKQRSLFTISSPTTENNRLMNVMDHINAHFGSNTLFPLSAGIKHAWKPRAAFLSQRYTTNVKELMVAKTWG